MSVIYPVICNDYLQIICFAKITSEQLCERCNIYLSCTVKKKKTQPIHTSSLSFRHFAVAPG